MNLMSGVIGGALGALVGAAIWAAVGHFTQYEIGWIAWGVGALVGFGVRAGMKGQGNTATGMLAVALALAGVILGKLAVIWIAFDEFTASDDVVIACFADDIMDERAEAGQPVRFTAPANAETIAEEYPKEIWREAERRFLRVDEAGRDRARRCPPSSYDKWIVAYIADGLAVEKEEAGETLAWPAGHSLETAYRESHYPPELWQEAQARWDAMSPAEQEAYDAQAIEFTARMNEQFIQERKGSVLMDAFTQSLGLYDLLWAALAIGTAFRLGAMNDGKGEGRPTPT